jgi:hypothetical protein
MTIEILLVCGFFVGLLVGAAVANPKHGAAVLLLVPVAMIFYIGWRQGQDPDRLRSTSSLDFIFGPLWPSLGAIGGFYAGRVLRSFFQTPVAEAPERRRRQALVALAIATGAYFCIGEQLIFSAALGRPMELEGPDVLVMNAALAAIPFLLLARRSSARALPWLLAWAVTACLHWWWLSKGIAYQKSPDGSGVPMFEALMMLISPLPIGALALGADHLLERRSSVG